MRDRPEQFGGRVSRRSRSIMEAAGGHCSRSMVKHGFIWQTWLPMAKPTSTTDGWRTFDRQFCWFMERRIRGPSLENSMRFVPRFRTRTLRCCRARPTARTASARRPMRSPTWCGAFSGDEVLIPGVRRPWREHRGPSVATWNGPRDSRQSQSFLVILARTSSIQCETTIIDCRVPAAVLVLTNRKRLPSDETS